MRNDNEAGEHLAQSIDCSDQAQRCRRLSRATYDRATAELLNRMAENFERGVAANEPD